MPGLFNELFRERFLLRRAERLAKSYSEPQRARVRELERAARARASVAASLRSAAETGPAFTLLREAVTLAVAAALVGAGRRAPETEVLAPSEAWRELAGLRKERERAPDFGSLEPLMSERDPLAADRMPLADALGARPRVEAVLAWLLSEVEVRSLRSIRARRALRIAGVALGFLVPLLALVVFAIR